MALSDQDLTPLSVGEIQGYENQVVFCPKCLARYDRSRSRCLASTCQDLNHFYHEWEGHALEWLDLGYATTLHYIIAPMILDYTIWLLARDCVNKEIAFPAFLDSSRDLRATLKTPSL